MRGGFLDGLCLFLEIKQHPAELRRWHQKIRRIYYIRLWFLFLCFSCFEWCLMWILEGPKKKKFFLPLFFCYFLIPLIMTYSYLLPKIDFNLLQMTKMETDNYSLILLFFPLCIFVCFIFCQPFNPFFLGLLRLTAPIFL